MASADANEGLLEGYSWSSLISAIVMAYNSTISRSTCYSPFELIYNRKPMFPIVLALNIKLNKIDYNGCIDDYIKKLAVHQRIIIEKMNVNQKTYDMRRKRDYDLKSID